MQQTPQQLARPMMIRPWSPLQADNATASVLAHDQHGHQPQRVHPSLEQQLQHPLQQQPQTQQQQMREIQQQVHPRARQQQQYEQQYQQNQQNQHQQQSHQQQSHQQHSQQQSQQTQQHQPHPQQSQQSQQQQQHPQQLQQQYPPQQQPWPHQHHSPLSHQHQHQSQHPSTSQHAPPSLSQQVQVHPHSQTVQTATYATTSSRNLHVGPSSVGASRLTAATTTTVNVSNSSRNLAGHTSFATAVTETSACTPSSGASCGPSSGSRSMGCPNMTQDVQFQSDGQTRRQDLCRGHCVGLSTECLNRILQATVLGTLPRPVVADLLYLRHLRTHTLKVENEALRANTRFWQDQCAKLTRGVEELGQTNRCITCYDYLTNDDLHPGTDVWMMQGGVELPVSAEEGRVRCVTCHRQVHMREPCSIAIGPAHSSFVRDCQRCFELRVGPVRGANLDPLSKHKMTAQQQAIINTERTATSGAETGQVQVQPFRAWNSPCPIPYADSATATSPGLEEERFADSCML